MSAALPGPGALHTACKSLVYRVIPAGRSVSLLRPRPLVPCALGVLFPHARLVSGRNCADPPRSRPTLPSCRDPSCRILLAVLCLSLSLDHHKPTSRRDESGQKKTHEGIFFSMVDRLAFHLGLYSGFWAWAKFSLWWPFQPSLDFQLTRILALGSQRLCAPVGPRRGIFRNGPQW